MASNRFYGQKIDARALLFGDRARNARAASNRRPDAPLTLGARQPVDAAPPR
jgi:hypothetical protein